MGSIHGRLSSIDEASSFFEKVQLHFQLSDLFVELVLFGVGLLAHLLAAITEDVGQTGQRLFLPAPDLGWVDAEHLRDLCCRLVRLDGLNGHLGLQAGWVTLAGFGHCLSSIFNAARHLRKGRFSVQKMGSTTVKLTESQQYLPPNRVTILTDSRCASPVNCTLQELISYGILQRADLLWFDSRTLAEGYDPTHKMTGHVGIYESGTTMINAFSDILNPHGIRRDDLLDAQLPVNSTYWIDRFMFAGRVAQGATIAWKQEATFPPAVDYREVVSFAVGDAGYILIPNEIQASQLWQYSPLSNSWTQLKAPPTIEFESPSFVVGGNAYVVSGTQVWQYSPTTDQWTRKTDIPGKDKRGGFGFAVNGFGYIGGGYGGASYNGCEFWQYNPGNDTWTAKNNTPVLEYGLNDPSACSVTGITFMIGNTAYVTGTDSYFWAYSPATDTWTMKAYVDAVYGQAFSIGLNGYVFNTHGAMYRYDSLADQWSSIGSTFPGTTMCYPAGFAIGGNLYVGIGGLFATNTCSTNVVNEWWEFQP